jgi:hypothetical protein
VDDGSSIGGALWTELPAGSIESAVTCAAGSRPPWQGSIVVGINNAGLDVAAMIETKAAELRATGAPAEST